MSNRSTAAIVLLLATVLLLPAPAAPYETDQYTHRLEEISDSTEILNREVNEALERVAAEWRHGNDRRRFATRVYKEIGGRHWVDKLERFAANSPEVERIDLDKQATIYGGMPFWSTPVVAMVGVGKTVKINDTLVGTDKIGHFLSQGWKYYKRHQRGLPEEKVVALGRRNEGGIFGAATTRVFSNADLVANYEGYLFYRSLFEDDQVTGKPAIVRFPGASAVIQRPFDWRDHVNEYWDEALNPNRYAGVVRKHVERNLIELCAEFQRQPLAFTPATESDLDRRYAHLGMRETKSLRLDSLCTGDQIGGLSPRPSSHR